MNGGFIFSQATLPFLLKGVEQKSQHPPSLIFTGATASVKANALVSVFASGKWALRALSQSLAKEFGPQGVHVSHAIIDGVINIPRTKEWLKELGPEAKLSAEGVCVLVLSTAIPAGRGLTKVDCERLLVASYSAENELYMGD